jgi:hypothetical protein
MHTYEVRLRKDQRGVDLISDALPFGRLWYAEPNAISNAVGYAKFYSRSHGAVIGMHDKAGNVIEESRPNPFVCYRAVGIVYESSANLTNWQPPAGVR